MERTALKASGDAVLWEVRREGGAYIRTILQSIGERCLNLLQQDFDLMNCLPYEVCLYIFSFLDPRSILTAATVCTSWHVIASDLSLWKHLYEHALHLALVRWRLASPDDFFPPSLLRPTATATSHEKAPLASPPSPSPWPAVALCSSLSSPAAPPTVPTPAPVSCSSSSCLVKVHHHHQQHQQQQQQLSALSSDDPESSEGLVGNTIFADEKEIRSGSLGHLVERLVAEKPPESYVNVFLLTYRTFTTPTALLTTLLSLYQRADSSPSCCKEEKGETWFPFPPYNGECSIITMEEEADIRALKFRICNIIKVWVDEYFEDIRDSPSLFPLLITFVLGKLIREGRGTLANIIKASIYNKFHPKPASKLKRLSTSDIPDANSLSPPKPKLGKLSLASPRLSITDISEEEAARQLTLIEHSAVGKIKVHELLNPQNKVEIVSAINHSNRLSLWVVATILHQETPRSRAKTKARFINIALHLRNLNNFNGMLAVIGATSSPAVSRLAETSAELKRKRSSVLRVERELLALAQNAREFNKDMLSAPKPPGIPSLAMCLAQLSLINSVHSDTFEGLVNFVKRQIYCTDVLFPFREYQKAAYNLLPVPEIQTFLMRGVNSPNNEPDLYNLSLAIEP